MLFRHLIDDDIGWMVYVGTQVCHVMASGTIGWRRPQVIFWSRQRDFGDQAVGMAFSSARLSDRLCKATSAMLLSAHGGRRWYRGPMSAAWRSACWRAGTTSFRSVHRAVAYWGGILGFNCLLLGAIAPVQIPPGAGPWLLRLSLSLGQLQNHGRLDLGNEHSVKSSLVVDTCSILRWCG
jgi:hypothetical protein